ncbi:hypothetical protein [Streptomyces sp. NPDC001286]
MKRSRERRLPVGRREQVAPGADGRGTSVTVSRRELVPGADG